METDLQQRYCSLSMTNQWKAESRVRLERSLWVAALEAQHAEGLPVEEDTFFRYRAATSLVGMQSILDAERRTGHEIAARLVEFNTVAKAEGIHQGMTSCDVSDAATQVQVLRSAAVVRLRSVSLIKALRDAASEAADQECVAVTHNRAAQPTTWGRRVSMWLEEAVYHHRAFLLIAGSYPLRGLVGAVGTGRDLVGLFDSLGVADPVAAATRTSDRYLESVREMLHLHLGDATQAAIIPSGVCQAPGQNHHRSADVLLMRVASMLVAAPTNYAVTGRLMAGRGLLSEVYDQHRVGSSAMPHKINPSRMERVAGLAALNDGYLQTVERAAAGRWYEGDVADSAARRVALPGFWMSLEAVLVAATRLVTSCALDVDAAAADVAQTWDELLSGRLLSTVIDSGMPREEAHELIRHLYSSGSDPVDGVADLLGLDEEQTARLVSPGGDRAAAQTAAVVADADRLLAAEHEVGIWPPTLEPVGLDKF
jgi:adenylosuccinate lyase